MTIDLIIQGILKIVIGFIIIGLLLFVPAGTIAYWNGWLLLKTIFIPMFILGIVLLIGNPKLLMKRLNAKEKQEEQKNVIRMSGLMFILGFIIAGLNYRFGWIFLPRTISNIAAIIYIIEFILYAEVLRENEYLSRTVEIQKDQKVIDTGLYSIIRHPMYSITIIMFLMIPLILGSISSFIIFLCYPAILIKRIKNEEELLEKDLKGYKEYQKKVKYKLIPWIW